jgi:hypothetical protein
MDYVKSLSLSALAYEIEKDGKLYSISTPCLRSASGTYYHFLRQGLAVRMWKSDNKKQVLVF